MDPSISPSDDELVYSTPKQPVTLEVVDLGPFEPEEVEVKRVIVSPWIQISSPAGAGAFECKFQNNSYEHTT